MTAAGRRETERLFVGVEPPVATLVQVGTIQEALREELSRPGLRFMRPEQLHVTLAFLGEVGEDARAAAARVVSELHGSMGGEAEIGGLLLLPSVRKARVIALAIDDAAGALTRVHDEVTRGLVAAGVYEPERRAFRPHLTIARLREPAELRPKSDSRRVRMPVESVCLYRSRSTRDGARYEVVTRAGLAVPGVTDV